MSVRPCLVGITCWRDFFVLQAIGAFGVIDRVKYGEWSGKSGDEFTQSLNILQILVSIILFWVGHHRTKTVGLGGALLLAIVTFLFVSVIGRSIRRLRFVVRSYIYSLHSGLSE